MKASVYQRKSDMRWVGAINNGKNQNGKRVRITVYGDTKKEVEQKVNVILYELQTGQYIKESKDSLVGYLREYYKVCESDWEETTAALYKMYIDIHFAPYFNDIKLADIRPITLDNFYNYKMTAIRKYQIDIKGELIDKEADPLSVNTVRKLNSFLRSAFAYAVANDMIKTNPTDKVKLAKKEKYLPRVYNEDQFNSLLELVEGTHDEIPIILGGGCGLRRGEIFGLYWRDVDFKTGYIAIQQTAVRFDKNIEKDPKNQSSCRVFKAPQYVMEILEQYKKNTGGKMKDKVITKWKPGTYSERFKLLLKNNGMDHIRLHDLRHYNAVMMCKYGVSDKVAAERLGHSQVSTLRNVYQHVLKDMDTTAAEEINAMFIKRKDKEERKANLKAL